MKRWPFLCIVLLLALLPACGPATTPTPAPSTSEPSSQYDGQALLQERCTTCHSLSKVEDERQTPEEWKATVDEMVELGAVLTPEEASALIDYLAQTYPK
jgi:mono/diheme cytochrome c family protein